MNKSSTAASHVVLQCLLVAVVLLGAAVHGTSAVTCSPLELISCVEAISGSQSPSAECCQKLREQRPCLCGYLKNPNLQPYVGSPNAKKVATACGVSTPTC